MGVRQPCGDWDVYLRRELNATDYNPQSNDLTTLQMELIVRYLGVP
jgi:hypothetical protein